MLEAKCVHTSFSYGWTPVGIKPLTLLLSVDAALEQLSKAGPGSVCVCQDHRRSVVLSLYNMWCAAPVDVFDWLARRLCLHQVFTPLKGQLAA